MFLDDVFLFGGGHRSEWKCFIDVIHILCVASGMEVNSSKYCFIAPGGVVDEKITNLFPFSKVSLDEGFTYLGFSLKPNGYGKKDWNWLLVKMEKKLGLWCYRCL